MHAISHVRIATRRSALALWQAEYVAAQLRMVYPQLSVSLVPIVTQGDKLLDTPLARIGGKGLFIKELEVAIEANEADIAVHSMKDLGVTLPDGFALSSILKRELPYDAFVSNLYDTLDSLPQGAKVGTCSLRRRMQLTAYRPDLTLIDLRGNVQTRLAKLDEGQFDAIILASAGLIRLGLVQRIRHHLDVGLCLPAIGQGAIGIECRDAEDWLSLLAPLNDADTALCVHSERIINARLQGSCQVPIAAHAYLDGEHLHFAARIGTPDAKKCIEFQQIVNRNQSDNVAHAAADALIEQGALDILAQLNDAS